MIAIIPAGGGATRLWPLSKTTAKPLLLIGGKPILSHLVEKIPASIPIIITVNEQYKDDFRNWLKRYHPKRKRVEIFVEPAAPDGGKLGALGSLAYVLKKRKIHDDILIVLGDNVITFDLADFIARAKNKILLAAYDLGSRQQAKRFGVLTVDKSGKITKFKEKPSQPDSALISTGAYHVPKKYLQVFQQAAARNRDNMGGFVEFLVDTKEEVYAYRFTTPWYDIGSFSVYLEVHRKMTEKSDNARLKQHGNTIKGAVFVDPSAQVTNSVIEDSMILDHCVIDGAHIRSCIIDSDCVIRGIDLEYKMIESKTVLDAQ